MISLFDMFKVGIGPSSSHTVGPMKAGKQFVDDLVEKGLLNAVTRVAVDVYGSLSLTGKGHHTDIAIIMGLAGNQPDTVDIDAIPAFIRDVEEHFGKENANELQVPYPFKSAQEMLAYCKETGLSLSGMVMQNELALHSKKEIEDYFANVWQTMRACIDRGMNTEGVLPGPLRVPRRASALRRLLVASDKLSSDPMNVVDWVNMFALAVNEENAAGGRVVTAPTNGACGIVPAVLAYYDHFIESVSPEIYIRYFMACGAIGALYKMNASISGAEVGCQGEVGVACSMAAAGLAELLGASPEQVCVAAEIGMEHNLGLTCDPVAGQVQVPCIERNAIASVKAINAARMAMRRTSEPRVSLDKVIETMYETGKDMNAKYRETSRGGLAIKVQCD